MKVFFIGLLIGAAAGFVLAALLCNHRDEQEGTKWY